MVTYFGMKKGDANVGVQYGERVERRVEEGVVKWHITIYETGVCPETAVINSYAKPLAMRCLVCLPLDRAAGC